MPLVFAPDGNLYQPGALSAAYNVVGTANGYQRHPFWAESGVYVSENTVGNVAQLRTLSAGDFIVWGGKRTDGTKDKLWKVNAGVGVTDLSKAGDYTAGSTWRFSSFGNILLATNYSDAVQASSSGGTFADLAGSPPKARLIEEVADFVMLANYNDGSAYADGWWCSALGNHTSWTPSTATQAANGRLYQSPGPIVALKKLGSMAVAYKQSAIHIGQYLGPPVIWAWEQIPGTVGSISHEATVSTGQAHFGYCPTNRRFWVFDGTRPRFIDDGIQWSVSRPAYDHRAGKFHGVFDSARQVVWWFRNADGSGNLVSYYAYHIPSGRWATGDFGQAAAGGGFEAAATQVGGLGWLMFSGNHALMEIGSTEQTPYRGAATLTTGWYGSNERTLRVTEVYPVSNAPAQAVVWDKMTPTYADGPAGTSGYASGSQQSANADGRFSWHRDAHWHSFSFAATSTADTAWTEVVDIGLAMQPAGKLYG